jgi:uncharacterized membrane protein YeaQ/YmgE (transglycosylase-associated protein family)
MAAPAVWKTRREPKRQLCRCQAVIHQPEVAMLAPESVLAWVIIGAIAGWLAGLLVKGYGFGLIGNIVIGILGAGIAGILAPRLGLYTQSAGGNIVAALVGALILLFLVGLVRRT